MPPRKRDDRLSAGDWTAAALDALAAGGVAAVAVEPLAARLGTTKGSFYWHFANRDALVTAALERWEHEHTEQIIALLEHEPDPMARLRTLLATVLGANRPPDAPTAGQTHTVELALQATADHPLVAPVLARVTERRISYVADLFAALGFDRVEADRRGLLAYTAYLGHAQLTHATPARAPTGPALTAYVDGVLAILTARDRPVSRADAG